MVVSVVLRSHRSDIACIRVLIIIDPETIRLVGGSLVGGIERDLAVAIVIHRHSHRNQQHRVTLAIPILGISQNQVVVVDAHSSEYLPAWIGQPVVEVRDLPEWGVVCVVVELPEHTYRIAQSLHGNSHNLVFVINGKRIAISMRSFVTCRVVGQAFRRLVGEAPENRV